MDPSELPYRRLLNAFVVWLQERMPGENEWAAFAQQMNQPPPEAVRDGHPAALRVVGTTWDDVKQQADELGATG